MPEAPRPAAGTARLRSLAALVPPGSRVVDVGSDHGLLALRLVTSGRVPRCYATERRQAPALAALAARTPGLSARFGDGLDALGREDTVDVIVIAGMGARAIIRILERAPRRLAAAHRLVLQPQSDWARLRAWLAGAGFGRFHERLVAERGQTYLALAAEPGDFTATVPAGLDRSEWLEAGPGLVLRRDPLALARWRGRVAWLERAAAGCDPCPPRLAARLARARRILAGFGCDVPGSPPE